jgi:hypothetical protein
LLSIEEEKKRADELAKQNLGSPWAKFLDWLL